MEELQSVLEEWRNTPNILSFLGKCRVFFKRHMFIMSIFLFILVVSLGYVASIFYWWPIKTDSSSKTVWVFVNQKTVPKETSLPVQVKQEISKEELAILIDEFVKEAYYGSLDQGLQKYEKLLEISNNSSFFTAENIIDNTLEDKLTSIENKILNEGDTLLKSNLFQEKGVTEYEIWNQLYYLDSQRYGLPFLYYALRALHSFDASIELNDNALAHRYKGTILLDLGKARSAIAIVELKKSIALDSNDEITYYKLWNANRTIKEYGTAIGYYLSGLTINPKNELIQVNLWIAYFKHGDREKWYEIDNDLINNCIDYCNLANYNFAVDLSTESPKDYGKILSLFDAAIQAGKMKNEIYRNAYRMQWKVFYELKNREKAITALNMSLNDPSDRQTGLNMFNINDIEEDSYVTLAKIYMESGDLDMAERYLKQGIKKYPNEEGLTVLMTELIQMQTRK